MKFMNIMIPYDKSEHSHYALELARGLAEEDSRIKLHVVGMVSVTDIPPALNPDMTSLGELPATMMDPQIYRELADEATAREVREMRESIGNMLDALPNETEILSLNHPSVVDGIVEFADEHGCDLIVMGSRGLGILRGMLGSVSRGVLREAEIPVLIAKKADEKVG